MEWTLYYWSQDFPGRGEFVRLIFAQAGVEYEESNQVPAFLKEEKSNPVFAVPAIKHNPSGFVLSNSSSVLRYLAKKLDNGSLLPKGEEKEAIADSLTTAVADVVAEGLVASHPYNVVKSYEDNEGPVRDEYMKWMKDTRMPKWLNFFQDNLDKHGSADGFMFGEDVSYVDLALFHLFEGCDAEFGKEIMDAFPKLRALQARVGALPRVAARTAKRGPFSKTGLCC